MSSNAGNFLDESIFVTRKKTLCILYFVFIKYLRIIIIYWIYSNWTAKFNISNRMQVIFERILKIGSFDCCCDIPISK